MFLLGPNLLLFKIEIVINQIVIKARFKKNATQILSGILYFLNKKLIWQY